MKRKLRILHCLETLGSGGVEQRRLLLARRLDPDVYEQQVICSKALRGFDARLAEHGVQVHPVGSLGKLTNFGYFKRLYRLVKQIKPDVIHGAVFEGVISAAVMGVLCRVPVVIIEETSDPQNRSWRGNFLMKICSSVVDFAVAISPSVHRYLRDTVGVPARKLRLINNGVGEPRQPSRDEIAEVRKELGIDDSCFVVGSVGRLRDFHKRFSDLIRATAILRNEIPEIRLLIVGTGEDAETLRNLAASLGVAQNVIFAGYQPDISPYYGCMDVFSLASHMEGFGLVLIEAMNFRLPVVATAVGGIKDIVEPGVTGYLVGRHAPAALAEHILALYKDPVLRRRMGEHGFDKAIREYGSDAYVDKVVKLYREAADKAGIKMDQ